MLGLRYMKTSPTEYVIHYRGGSVRREGAGLSFFYYAPTSTIVSVPLASNDLPFVFNETTADFQAVTVQGQISYRVSDPRRLAGILDYTVGPRGDYLSEDPDALGTRLVHAAQVLARDAVQKLTLRETLMNADRVAADVFPKLKKSDVVTMHGLEILGLSILSLKPTPEMAKALEAEAREALQRRSDQAIYERRNAAVEQERRIKESELKTEIAVEEQRTSLLELRTANERKDADARAYALETTLKPVRGMDWKTLLAVTAGGADPKLMIALAFRELAENARKIGELNVTPDLLKSLVTK